MTKRVRSAVFLSVLLLATCSDRVPAPRRGDRLPRSTTVAGIPVLADGTSPPGSPLPEGLTVPPATVLVGVPIPVGPAVVYKGKEILDHGWEAFLLVTGRPSEVVRSMLTQLEELGYTTTPGRECKRIGAVGFCSVGGARGPAHDRRYLSLRIHRGPAVQPSRYPASLAIISYRDEDPYPGSSTGVAVEPGAPDLRGADDVPIPSGWPPLAEEGDLIGEGVHDTPALRLPTAMSLAMPLMPYECIAGQYRALLRIDGDPVEAFRALHRQILGHPHVGSPTTAVRTELDRTTYQLLVSVAGSWQMEARMIIQTRTQAWLVIETCYD